MKKRSNLNKRVLEVLNNVDIIIANSRFTKNLAINVVLMNIKLL